MNRGGRPPKPADLKRGFVIALRFNVHEFKALSDALREGETIAEFCRDAALRAAKRRASK